MNLEDNSVGLRVHFAPQGFEVQRIVAPARALRAEVVILFTKSRTDDAAQQLSKVIRDLQKMRIQSHVLECEIWDAAAVVDEVGNIVSQAPQHSYFFNVSTGPKTAAIAGTISSMFWPIRAYYQDVDHTGRVLFGKEDFPLKGAAKFHPTFSTPPMDPTIAKSLDQIVRTNKPMSKRQLIACLKSIGAIHPRVEGGITPQAEHAQADVILNKLRAWGFIHVSGRGVGMRIQATEMGRGGVRMFRHALRSRPIPSALQT